MPKPTLTPKEELRKKLKRFKQRKANRTSSEVVALLTAWGFERRAATKEQGGVWQRGSRTLTLPRPHGSRDKTLAPRYVAIVIKEIEAAERERPLEIR